MKARMKRRRCAPVSQTWRIYRYMEAVINGQDDQGIARALGLSILDMQKWRSNIRRSRGIVLPKPRPEATARDDSPRPPRHHERDVLTVSAFHTV